MLPYVFAWCGLLITNDAYRSYSLSMPLQNITSPYHNPYQKIYQKVIYKNKQHHQQQLNLYGYL